MGRWDCVVCSSIGIRGDEEHCTGCGSPRPAGVRFYLPSESDAITDPEGIAAAIAGPDWMCGFCQGTNGALKTTCGGCGSSRSEMEGHQKVEFFFIGHEPRRGDIGQSEIIPRPKKSYRAERATTVSKRPEFPMATVRKHKPPMPTKAKILAGFGSALILSALYLMFRTHVEPMMVRMFSWERAIPVEAYRTVIEEDWSVPIGGRQLESWRAIHHYDKVVDHHETRYRTETYQVRTGTERYRSGTRSLGNGRFEATYDTRPTYDTKTRRVSYQEAVYRDEPVYRTKYKYEIERWVHDRTARVSRDDQKPFWPEIELGPSEREGTRIQKYTVVLINKESKSYEYSCDERLWASLNDDEEYMVKLNGLGIVQEIVFPEK